MKDNSTNATQIIWNYNNGNPLVTTAPGDSSFALYVTPGTYEIVHVAVGPGGRDTTRLSISVNPSPIVDFSVNSPTGCYPLVTTFQDLSNGQGSSVVEWLWGLGDGNISTVQNPTHAYRLSGTFNVSLTAKNSNGCSFTLTKPTFITVTDGVNPAFFNSFASACKPPSSIDFFNNSTGPGTLSHVWRFGDGSAPVNTQDPTHVYNAAGAYNVTLITTSSAGCTDSVSGVVDIPNVDITSSINAPDTACVNQLITFTNVSTPRADSSGWRFGDGTENTGASVTKRYLAPGVYTVRLTNLFGGCLDSVNKRIVITDTARVDFISADTAACRGPHSVRFQDRSVGAVSWLWNFGDGTTSTQQNPVKQFDNFGTYTVSLTITNRNGCTSTLTRREYIKILPPTVAFRNLPDSGCAPLTVTARALVNAPDGVASYFWTINGFTYSDSTPTVTFSSTGTFTASLAITTNGGCFATTSMAGAIRVGTRPRADFSATPRDNCASEPISFTNLSTGDQTGWRWDFGDTANRQQGSINQNPVYTYTDTGRFTVRLYTFNNGCVDSAVKVNYIRTFGAVARFGYQVNCTNKRQVSFLDSSIGAATLTWDFGDGSPTVTGVQNPVHTYASLNDYTVTLTATGGGCTYVLKKIVRIIDERANFTVSPNVLCRGAITTLTASAEDSNIFKWEWDYGNGILDTGRKVFQHIYDTPRVYPARLVITDINGCTDSFTRNIAVGGPRARFIATNPTGCVGLTVLFADSSQSDGVNAIVSRTWRFGDGNTQTINVPSVSHQYNLTGFFNVSLLVTDAVGCTDSVIQNSLVVATRPVAAFGIPDSISCPGRSIQFLTQSNGIFNPGRGSHLWTFGDGNTSDRNNATNVYAGAGVYDVKLRVTDRYGCSDSITKRAAVVIDTPFAAFTVSDTAIDCPPLIARFNNRSRFWVSARWDFGDGDQSVIPDTPTKIYNIPGRYLSRLIVTSRGGCTDTAFQNITIFGPSGTLTASPLEGCNPLTVNFNLSTRSTIEVAWFFGDTSVPQIGNDTVKTHVYANTGDITPRVRLTDSTGCPVVVELNRPIKVIGFNTGFLSDRTVLCDNGFVKFTDSTRTNGSIQTWEWDFGDGARGVGPDPTHFYNDTGYFDVKLKVTTQLGCTDSVTLPRYIKSVLSPVASIQSSDTACQNRFITYAGLVQPDTSALRWSWNFANGNTSTLQNPPTQQYLVPGTLGVRLLVTNSSGCVDTVLKNITIHPLPPLNAGTDTTLCLGQSVTLFASGAATYQWLPPNSSLGCVNCPTPLASPNITTTYRLRGTSADGCQVDDTVVVTVIQPTTVIAPPNDSLCLGQGMQLFARGTQVYSWSPATGLNNPSSSSPIARPTTTTTYVVTGSDARGCFVTRDSVTVSVFPLPTIDLGADITIPVGSSAQLNPLISNDVSTIQWSPTTGLSCTDCITPVAAPKQKTTYTATVTNNGGCTATDQLTVFVICNSENLFIPNTFSPNNDGMNDVFYPRGRGILRVKSMKVFSRWGQQVYWRENFLANDISAGWNGTFKGQLLSADVYVYMIDVICENNTVVTLKGDVMLVR